MKEPLGEYWLLDISFLLVPLWSTWNTLPLYYFTTINFVIVFWCKKLKNLIRENYAKCAADQRPLKFYYLKYIEIIDIQVASQKFFGKFMLWSMTWSMFTLAFAIYFATQTSYLLPENMTLDAKKDMIFIISWSCLQIITGIIDILVICISGIATNEAMRKVVSAVQEIVTEVYDEEARYQVECFKSKIDMQSDWGVTIGGAFLLERSTLFTLLGVISSYSLLLLELKGT